MKAFRLVGKWFAIGFFGVALHALPVDAAGVEEIARDFRPVSGVVVMTDGKEVIIDLDVSSGIAAGDIFSVLAPGKPVVHPTTQKVLGSLEENKSLLKVIQLKTGFSFARPLDRAEAVKRGDPVKRFYNLPAVFWDFGGDGKPLFLELQSALPDLKWQDYESAQRSRPAAPSAAGSGAAGLTFIYSRGAVEVRDPEFTVIRNYPAVAASPASAAPAAAVAPGAPAVAPAAARKESPPVAPGVQPQAVRPTFSKSETLANLPNVSLMADFIRRGDRLLMASTDGVGLEVYDVASPLAAVAKAEPPRFGTVLALKWWQPEADGPLRLAVTAGIDSAVSSSIWTFERNRLEPLQQNIPRILGTFDIDRDGRPETLLAQEFDAEMFFGQRIKEASWASGGLRYAEPRVPLPRTFTALGSAIADLTGDGVPETLFVRNELLFIYSGKRQIYKSPQEMGGSLSLLTFNRVQSSKNAQPGTAIFEISPVLVDTDGNGLPEIFLTASDRTTIGSLAPSIGGVKSTWVAVVRYQNGRFETGTLGEKLDLPLQGLWIQGRQILVVATERGDLAGEGSKSHLLAFSLTQ